MSSNKFTAGTNRSNPDSFASRQYRYRTSRRRGLVADSDPVLPAGVYRFRLGRDAQPQLLTADELSNNLHDAFARLILISGKLPLTLRELLAVIDATNAQADGLPSQKVFIVADGGQIPWTPAIEPIARQFRFLIARTKSGMMPELFISTSRDIDSSSTFLQVIGWDGVNGAFQFYDRRGQAWIWAGSSWDALENDTRGFGPFDSHVNGALNMKELKQPWPNWNSQAATIDSALAPDDGLRAEALWQTRIGAERLETEVIRPNVQRWIDSRFQRRTVDGTLTRLPELLGQILLTTTINLIASPDESINIRPGSPMHLPPTFFVNTDSLFDVLGLTPDISVPLVDGGIYLDSLKRFDVALTDGVHRFPGDTHFPFIVPEVAIEDIRILQGLLNQGIVTEKLAACLLMVDFCNPVFSKRRAALVRYIPAGATIGNAETFSKSFAQAVEASAEAQRGDSPEAELLNNWNIPEAQWRSRFESQIKDFFDRLKPRLTNVETFAEIFQLAESRRREFRKRPLAEFRLTTVITNISEDSPLLEFLPDTTVRLKA